MDRTEIVREDMIVCSEHVEQGITSLHHKAQHTGNNINKNSINVYDDVSCGNL